MAGVTRQSMKSLWVLISGKTILKSQELVGTALEKNAERISNGILFYKEPSSESLEAFKKEKKEEIQLEFIQKLSLLLNLAEEQCYDLFCSYLQYEFKGTQTNIKTFFGSERHIQTLLCDLWKFYYSERLYGLICLKHILSYWQDSSHPYKDLYEGFLETINKDGALIQQVIKQVESLSVAEVPNRFSRGQYLSESLLHSWVTSTLQEQCELLQILLLYYKDMEPTSEDFLRLLTVFQKNSFGQKLVYRQHIVEASQIFMDYIGLLEVLVLVEGMELEWLYSCQEREKSEDHFLLKDENVIKKLDGIICSFGNHPQHGPLLLGWLLVRTCTAGESMSDLVKNKRLGNLALQLDAFSYLAKGLSSPLFSGNEVSSVLAHSVVHQLLSVMFSVFELDTLGNTESLFLLGEKVLQHSHIAKTMWEKGLEAGIGILLKEAMMRFPLHSKPLLWLASSLAKANQESCYNIVAAIRQLPVFVELLEETNPREVIATNRDSVWQLVQNRYPYQTDTLVIPRGTMGLLLSFSDKRGQSVIQWRSPVNGWQIFLCHIHNILTKMSEGIGNISMEMIDLLVDISSLVSSILHTNPSAHELLTHISDALFKVFERFTLVPSPPTKLMGAYLEVAAALASVEPFSVWQKLSQLSFLPFMTGNSESIPQLASGIHTSVALFGQLLAAKECVIGEYPVTLAFLQLIANVAQLAEEDNPVFMACLIYILREIFPVYQRWHFTRAGDKEKIGQLCLTIFHKLFSSMSTDEQKKLGKSQAVCIYSFLHFEAGAALLQIVSAGEQMISEAYEQLGSPLIGSVDGLVAVVRLSLSVLNCVLLFKNKLKSAQNNNQVSGTFHTMKLSTPLEVALFSSPTERSQPHMVLNVAYYAFQKYDPRLATLSVQLLKRFAREFPMSLLACLGSEAEAIRDQFLMRLEAVTEDIRLKVALVEFLSVCIACQPGLMEMFVNVSPSSDEKNKSDDTESCLQIMLDILKEKEENKYYCPLQLHCAVVEFIHSLWAAQHMLAIETLKKNTSLWTLLCNPLLNTQIEDIDPKVAAHIIRTLALELFHSEVFERGKIDQPLESIFKTISSKHLLCTWSKYIMSSLPSPVDEELTGSTLDTSLITEKSRDSFILLTAWKDFLVVIAKAEPFRISGDKSLILEDILTAIGGQLSNPSNAKVLIVLSELYLVLLQKWSRDGIPSFGPWSNTLGNLLKDIAINKDKLHPRLQLSLISIVTTALHILQRDASEAIDLSDWVSPVCIILKYILVSAEKLIKNGQATAASLQLPVLCVCLLKELLEHVGKPDMWLPILQRHSILNILVGLLLYMVEHQCGLPFAHTILTFFLTLATEKQSAEMLHITDIVRDMNLILSGTYSSSHQSATLFKVNSHELVSSWLDVYHLMLQLMTSLLQTLRHFFIEDALDFIGVHLERLHYSLQQVRISPHTQEVHEAIITSWFIHHVAFHEKSWRIHHPSSLPVLLGDISEACHAAVAYLIKPKLLLHLAEHLKSEKSLDRKDSPKSSSSEHEGRIIRRLSSIEEVDKPLPVFTQVQTRLLQLLAIGLSALRQLSPSLCDLLSDQGVDVGQWQLMLHVNFSTPSIEAEGSSLSFGTILSCVNMCLQFLFKAEWVSSPLPSQTDSPVPVERELMNYILEVSLSLLLSQAVISQLSPMLTPRDKQLVSRELRAELNSIVVTVNRYLRKGVALSPAGSLASSVSPGQGHLQNLLYDKSFIELVSHLIDKLF